ncbi:MAG: class I SAM-dependent RNA methyltransferase [Acidobacteriota bacterium]|nr:class I SAM-dependent RNA methyltransferase [Acidobacteriota bacterium]
MKKNRMHRRSPQERASARSVPHAKPQLVRMEKPIYGGASLGRVDGKAIFVPLTLPGEVVRARVVEDRKSFAHAEVEEIVERAAERIEPACRHFGVCGGCHYQHTGYEQQVTFKKDILRETLQRGQVEFNREIEVLTAEPWAYRNRIRLAADRNGNFGYRSRRSHDLVAIAECPIAATLLVRAAMAFANLTKKLSLSSEDITLFCNDDETELLCSVTVRDGGEKQWLALAAMWSDVIAELSGVQFEQNSDGGRLPRIVAQWGEAALHYRAAGSRYRVDRGAFFQVNRWLVDQLAERVTDGLAGDTAWDLYAGVGLFAKQLTKKFDRVCAVESAPQSTAALAHNLGGTNGEPVAEDALAFARENRTATPDAIVVDPPRTGLGPELTAQLGEIRATSLTYVSCDPATLARDLKVLTESGYELASVTLADMFPQTFHIETIVQLRER